MKKANSIQDDPNLLMLLVHDAKHVPMKYRPGKYYNSKCKSAVSQILKHGLNDFRGFSSTLGASFTDSMFVDVRQYFDFGLRRFIKFICEKVFPINLLFDNQVSLTRSYIEHTLKWQSYYLSSSNDIKEVLNKYKFPYSTDGGCVWVCNIDGEFKSVLYLEQLIIIDNLNKHVDFRKAKTFFEIGGGFGSNLCLIIENYPNIRKFIYLDIVPNLYVGTQYLKSHYGEKVKDYAKTKDLEKIEFLNNDELEIFCIAPWQIENLDVSIDLFLSVNSFVSMPIEIIKNYILWIEKILSPLSTILLVKNDNLDQNKTVYPDKIPSFFTRKFEKYQYANPIEINRNKNYYIGTNDN